MHRYERWMGDYAAGRLGARRAHALARHVQHCADCAEALRHERGGPSHDRLPAPPQQGPLTAQTLLGTHYSLPQDRGHRSRRSSAFIPAAVLLMVFALVGAMTAMSWFLGAPAAHGAPEGDPAESWNATARELDAEAVNQLRLAGWTCPVIEAAGFNLASASGTLAQGAATVTLVLSDGKHTVKLAETRMMSGAPAPALQHSSAAGASIDPTSGMLTELGHRLGAKAAAAVTYDDGTATLNLEGVRYRVTTDLSKADVEGILQRLVVGEHTRIVSLDPTGENVSQRLLRGFSRLMVLDFQ